MIVSVDILKYFLALSCSAPLQNACLAGIWFKKQNNFDSWLQSTNVVGITINEESNESD